MLISQFHIKALLTALLCSASIVASASEVDSVKVSFPVAHSTLLLDFDRNGERLDSIIRTIESASADGSLRDVRVTGSASPEGSDEFNRHLSRARATSIFSFVSSRVALPDSLTSYSYLGADWTGLRNLVEADENVPFRCEVIDLLDSDISDPAVRLARLKALRSGKPYAYLLSNLFPTLRVSSLSVDFLPVSRLPLVSLSPLEQPSAAVTEFAAVASPFSSSTPRRSFYMALKTNLLYDALAAPSLGAEFYVGRNWSVGLNWIYGWWDNDSRHRYWRIYGGDLVVRRWFGNSAARKPLTGHHVGVYGGSFTFDFEFGGKGVMGGRPRHTLWDRCLAIAGVEYGYSLPIASRLNLDFTIGFGYIGGRYIKYEPMASGGYKWLSTHRLNWYGPTKAEVSLVWLIGRGNVNRK